MVVKEVIDAALRDADLRGLSSARVYRYAAGALLAGLGTIQAGELTEADLEDYTRRRLEAGRAPSTVNVELSILARGLKLAYRRGQIERRITVERLPVRNARTGFLRPGEFRRLWATLEVLDLDVADLVRWLYLTGWRSGEAKRLQWEDVDMQSLTVELSCRKTKNGHPRRLRLPRELSFLLLRRSRVRKGPYVFHRSGRRIRDFRGVWRRAREAIGRPGLLVHDLRRSFARNALEAGVPQRVAMELGGWLTESVFHRYAIVDEGQVSRALSRVFRYVQNSAD